MLEAGDATSLILDGFMLSQNYGGTYMTLINQAIALVCEDWLKLWALIVGRGVKKDD